MNWIFLDIFDGRVPRHNLLGELLRTQRIKQELRLPKRNLELVNLRCGKIGSALVEQKISA
jgi:hypothetical protein